MTIHRVIDSPFRDGGGNKPIWGTSLDLSNPLCRGLVRYWHFGEASGPLVADLVNQTGNLVGTNTSWAGGPSMVFDGATAFAASADDRGIPGIINQVGPFANANDAASVSIMCWFKPAANNSVLMGRWDENPVTNTSKIWFLAHTSTNTLWWAYNSNDGSGNVPRAVSTNTVNMNAWNFAGCSFTNTSTSAQMLLNLNGTISVNSGIWFAAVPNVVPGFVMGADRNGAGKTLFYNGNILAAAIWTRWLDTDELQKLYYEPWSIYLESNVRRWYQTTTMAPCPPLVPRVPDPQGHPDRLVHFTQIVGTILNSLLTQCQITQIGQGTFSIDAAAVFGTAAVTSFNTRTGAITLQATDLPIFTAAAPGAVPASGGGTANFIRADGSWAAPVGNVTSVSNSDGTLTISPTTGLVVASLALGHANTWTATQTIDATHHLILSEMTPGSILFAGTSGQVSQDNANLFYDNANKRVGFFTNVPSFPFDSDVSVTSGAGWNCNHLQTQPNSTDTGDTGFDLFYNLTASSAVNELICTGFAANCTNTLTGGGHIQTFRSFIVIHYSNTGTTTDLWDMFSIDVGANSGTVTTMRGFVVQALQGGNQIGIQINTLGGTNSTAFLEGAFPSGVFGVYIADNIPSFFGGWMRQSQGLARVTADRTNATASLTNLTDVSVTLVAGRSYFGRMVVKAANSTAAEGIQFDFNGGGATMTNFWASVKQIAGTAATLGTDISTSLAGVLNYTAMGGTADEVFEFQIALTVNAAGTFIPRFAENSHTTGTATVRLGSFLLLEDSPN